MKSRTNASKNLVATLWGRNGKTRIVEEDGKYTLPRLLDVKRQDLLPATGVGGCTCFISPRAKSLEELINSDVHLVDRPSE